MPSNKPGHSKILNRKRRLRGSLSNFLVSKEGRQLIGDCGIDLSKEYFKKVDRKWDDAFKKIFSRRKIMAYHLIRTLGSWKAINFVDKIRSPEMATALVGGIGFKNIVNNLDLIGKLIERGQNAKQIIHSTALKIIPSVEQKIMIKAIRNAEESKKKSPEEIAFSKIESKAADALTKLAKPELANELLSALPPEIALNLYKEVGRAGAKSYVRDIPWGRWDKVFGVSDMRVRLLMVLDFEEAVAFVRAVGKQDKSFEKNLETAHEIKGALGIKSAANLVMEVGLRKAAYIARTLYPDDAKKMIKNLGGEKTYQLSKVIPSRSISQDLLDIFVRARMGDSVEEISRMVKRNDEKRTHF
ncbi:MAG: hypothetical protein ABID38_01560 [Candidatus Diapherotrites archaeon]